MRVGRVAGRRGAGSTAAWIAGGGCTARLVRRTWVGLLRVLLRVRIRMCLRRTGAHGVRVLRLAPASELVFVLLPEFFRFFEECFAHFGWSVEVWLVVGVDS